MNKALSLVSNPNRFQLKRRLEPPLSFPVLGMREKVE
jgi:hypothetical protein